MDFWIPSVLKEIKTDPSYTECICPKCSETVIHHVGVSCRKYSCPKCGGILERRGDHELSITSSKVANALH
jgi:predicted RNA-binding Zn-ribbon protein involved in translation (DUF1610 family)